MVGILQGSIATLASRSSYVGVRVGTFWQETCRLTVSEDDCSIQESTSMFKDMRVKVSHDKVCACQCVERTLSGHFIWAGYPVTSRINLICM